MAQAATRAKEGERRPRGDRASMKATPYACRLRHAEWADCEASLARTGRALRHGGVSARRSVRGQRLPKSFSSSARAGAYTPPDTAAMEDRKSTRLNSSHEWISYAVF